MRVVALITLLLCPDLAAGNPFAAAGRLESVETGGGCSASLIAEDIVVTAAHCVEGAEADSLLFRPGDAAAAATVPATRIVVHPFYADFSGRRFRRLRFDIAVVKLAFPVSRDRAEPFPLADEAQTGEGLFIVSWRRGEGSRPRQRRCLVIEGQVPGVVTLGCRVSGGESGAPVLRLTEDGMELVAIVNSRSRQGTQPVALAADVRLRILPLLDRLRDTP